MQRFVGVSTPLAARTPHRKRSRLYITQHEFLRLVFIRPPVRRHGVQISDWIACSRRPARQVDHHVKLIVRKRPVRIVRRISCRNHRRVNLRPSPLSGPPTSERIAFPCHRWGCKFRSAFLSHIRAANAAVCVECHRTRPMSIDRHILRHNRLSRHLRPTYRRSEPAIESVTITRRAWKNSYYRIVCLTIHRRSRQATAVAIELHLAGPMRIIGYSVSHNCRGPNPSAIGRFRVPASERAACARRSWQCP